MKSGFTYFRLCHVVFIIACCVGTSSALSYLNLVTPHDWATWRPLLGIALLFASMLLSFIGYAKTIQAGSHSCQTTKLPAEHGAGA